MPWNAPDNAQNPKAGLTRKMNLTSPTKSRRRKRLSAVTPASAKACSNSVISRKFSSGIARTAVQACDPQSIVAKIPAGRAKRPDFGFRMGPPLCIE